MSGTTSSDSITGTTNADTIDGLEGDDTIIGLDGADELRGNSGDDSISGGGGDDSIRGGLGNDIIDGGDGADGIRGADGNDTITGGNGADVLLGGNGADVFIFNSVVEAAGDIILDWEQIDQLHISVGGFGGGLTTSTDLAAEGRFITVNGNDDITATSAEGVGQFIFRLGDRGLFWDADGAGAGAAELVAIVRGVSVLTSDITLIA